MSVNYCDVQGGWPTGTGNIDADPKFRDAEFRITIPSSPCREAGIDSVEYESVWYRAPATSFFWWWPRPNPKGTRPDIGAAEDPWPVDVPDSRTANLPSVFALEQNYPNPFNPATVIRYEVPSVAAVKLVVYDLLGRAVAVLANETMAPGRYEVRFDATGLASGVYLCRLTAGDFAQTRKMVVLR